MAVQTLKLRGEEFVVIPKKEYLQLKRSRRPSAEDLADIAEIERIKADPTQKPIPWAEAKKRLR